MGMEKVKEGSHDYVEGGLEQKAVARMTLGQGSVPAPQGPAVSCNT